MYVGDILGHESNNFLIYYELWQIWYNENKLNKYLILVHEFIDIFLKFDHCITIK